MSSADIFAAAILCLVSALVVVAAVTLYAPKAGGRRVAELAFLAAVIAATVFEVVWFWRVVR